jgi:carbonic anhydrase
MGSIDFSAAVRKQYAVVPVPRNFIKSTGKNEAHILWVGCSDSLIVETETLDVLAQELIVHRNFGDIVSNGDLSSVSAVQWAVDLLKVCSPPGTLGGRIDLMEWVE